MNHAFTGVLIEPVIHLLQLQIVRACKAKRLCATCVRLRFIKEKMDRMDQKKKKRNGQRPIFPPLPFFSARLPSLFKQCVTPAFVIHRESVVEFQEMEPLCLSPDATIPVMRKTKIGRAAVSICATMTASISVQNCA